jgi:hypothetical protein
MNKDNMLYANMGGRKLSITFRDRIQSLREQLSEKIDDCEETDQAIPSKAV